MLLHYVRGRHGRHTPKKNNRRGRLLSLPATSATARETYWLLFMNRGFSLLPYAYLSALLFPHLSAWLAASGVSLHQSQASICGNKPPSIFLHPTPHNGSFFTLTQWYEKKKKTDEMRVEKENKRCSYNWPSLGDGGRESIDNLGNAKQTSARGGAEIDEEGGWRTK